MGLASLAACAAVLTPAFGHNPITPGAGRHGYPAVFCWDGRGDPFLGQPDLPPKILSINGNFGKREPAAGEWLTWKPYWRNRLTGEWTVEPWKPAQFLAPGEDVGPYAWFDFPTQDIDPRTGRFYTFKRGLYDVGAWYAWFYAGSSGWILDYNTIPNLRNSGYFRREPRGGTADDDLCGLDPARDLILIPITTAAGRMSGLQRLSRSQRISSLGTLRRSDLAMRRGARMSTQRCFGRRATIVGTEDSDLLVGTSRSDVIVGLGGDDAIFGDRGNDYICGGDGADGLLGEQGSDRLAGEEGDDTLLGAAGNDRLVGGDGIDIAEGGAGRDRLSGGGQLLDILAYLFSSHGVQVDIRTGKARGDGRDSFQGFNAVVGSSQDDALLGAAGEQWFVPLAGDDRVNGRSGSDIVVYFRSEQGVTVNLTEGLAAGEGDDGLAGLEIVVGSRFADHIVGDAGYNYLLGLEGNDVLDGMGGDDTLEGGEGDDMCHDGYFYVTCENQPGSLAPPPVPTPEAPSGATEGANQFTTSWDLTRPSGFGY